MGIAYAMGGLPGGGGQGGGFTAFIPLVLMFVVFYFLLIRPQQKKQRDIKEMLSSLKTGDQIVTSGGLYGTIIGFGEDNRIKVRSQRTSRLTSPGAPSQARSPQRSRPGSRRTPRAGPTISP